MKNPTDAHTALHLTAQREEAFASAVASALAQGIGEPDRATQRLQRKLLSQGYTVGDALADLLFIVAMLTLIWGSLRLAEFAAWWLRAHA